MKYCPRCGYPNPDDAKFCIKCGYQFPELTTQQPPQPLQAPPTAPPPAYGQPQSGGGKKFPLIPIVAVMAVVIVVVVVLAAVLPGITGGGGNTLASAADHAFGGNWKVNSSKSGTATISGNTVTIAYLNGTTQTMSLSSYASQNSLGQALLTGISKLSTYYLVNGNESIQIGIVYNAKSDSSLMFFVGLAESFSKSYNYSGGTFYLSSSSGYDEVLTMYNGNLYSIDFYNFTPSVQEITTFLNQAVA